MNVLVIGKGARARFGLKLAKSPRIGKVFCAGNAGTRSTRSMCPSIFPDRFRLAGCASRRRRRRPRRHRPEDPRSGVDGSFAKRPARVRADQGGAQLSEQAVFAKNLMRHADVPTSEFRIFDHSQPAALHRIRSTCSW